MTNEDKAWARRAVAKLLARAALGLREEARERQLEVRAARAAARRLLRGPAA
ncbi:MAG: hypothetical protein ACTHK2_03840 [Dokdonella sp.]|uniref:hypothetical protein n=1 Tax=Dokdonella sp. TaxID=2291710 RepID=UPI003F7DAC9B